MKRFKKLFAVLMISLLIIPNFMFDTKKVKALPALPLIIPEIVAHAGPVVHNFIAWWSQVQASGVDQQLPEVWAYFTERFYTETESGLQSKPDKAAVLENLDLWIGDQLLGLPTDNTAIANEIESMYPMDVPVSEIPDPINVMPGVTSTNRDAYMNFISVPTTGTKIFTWNSSYVGPGFEPTAYQPSWANTYNGSRTAFFQFNNSNEGFWLTLWIEGRYVNAKVVTTNDKVGNVTMTADKRTNGISLVSNGNMQKITIGGSLAIEYNVTDTIPDPIESDYSILPGSPLATGSPILSPSFSPEIYDMFNGLSPTIEGLQDEIKENRKLQEKILLQMLDDSETHSIYFTPNEPIRNPITGELEYPQNVIETDVIDNPWGIGQILERIWQAIKAIPDYLITIRNELLKIPEQLRTAWERLWEELSGMTIGLITGIGDLFAPLWGFLAEIPIFLQGIWDAILGLPGVIIGGIRAIFIPDIPITWQGLIEPTEPLLNEKYPWIIPAFDKLKGAYETPFTDVYVDLVFPIPGHYKIIDFSWLNSQRDLIRSILRAFFWIFIVMYNIDMVYKLIRGNSLFYKTLVPSQIEVIKGGKK